MSKLVSIIIATYNRAAYIENTLNAIASQTYQNFECIIIDDGSTDNTAAIVDPIVSSDFRFNYIVRPDTIKKGANYSRNYGFSLSKGEYIKFFDSDDVMLPDHIEICVTTLEQGNYDFVVADCINFDGKNLLERPYEIDRVNSPLSAMHFAQWKTAWITNDLLLKRHFANQLEFRGGIRDQASEYQYNIKLLLLTDNGFLIPKILTHRLIHDDGFVVKAKKDKLYFDAMNAELYYVTALYIKDLALKPLLNWLLSSHVTLTFKISIQQKWPKYILGATVLLLKVNGLKGLLYPIVILSGVLTKKGYKIAKYVRD